MKVGVIGTGYVGLVTGACFADAGHTVLCADRDEAKVKKLWNAQIPIYEPGLDEIVERSVKHGRLKFSTSNSDAVRGMDFVFLAVGTPTLPNGETDLSYLEAAVKEVARAMDGYCILVTKSTVPVGTHRKVAQWVRENTNHEFDVVSNPEFLKEGTAVLDFQKPDRVVVGTTRDGVFQKMCELYAPFVRQGNPILRMDPLSAEIAKYACNAFLATRISFMNELSLLCENLGGDIEWIRQAMATDVRIGKHFLYPGVGYGGSCFPKDIKALLTTARRSDVLLRIVDAAERANEYQKGHLFHRMETHFGKDQLKGKVVGVLGLAFKPQTDDIREAPALVMIEKMLTAGMIVKATDPIAIENVRAKLGSKIQYCDEVAQVADGAHALVLMTEWSEYRNLNFPVLRERMKEPVFFDGRNIYSPSRVRESGFTYYCIGRP